MIGSRAARPGAAVSDPASQLRLQAVVAIPIRCCTFVNLWGVHWAGPSSDRSFVEAKTLGHEAEALAPA